jgi:hypothetical protein
VIRILLEASKIAADLFVIKFFEVEAPFHTLESYGLEVHKVEVVYGQSTVCLPLCLLFLYHYQVPCCSSKAFPKYVAIGIQLIGTCVVNCACLQESNAYRKLHFVLYILVQ